MTPRRWFWQARWRRLHAAGWGFLAAVAASILAACGTTPRDITATPSGAASAGIPTPAAEALTVTGTSASGESLRLIVPAITVHAVSSPDPIRVFLALVDPQGTYSYLLYPANRPGDTAHSISLVDYPLEVGVGDTTASIALWAVAYRSPGPSAAPSLGLDALATTLALSFRTWLTEGSPTDDPLAGAVRASNGALYAWFAQVDVAGQVLAWLDPARDWNAGLGAIAERQGTLTIVYDINHVHAGDGTPAPGHLTPTPTTASL